MVVMKKKLITAVFVIVGFCIVYIAATIQTGASYSKCNKLIYPPKEKWMNEDDAKLLAYSLVDCMEKNNGIFARLFFNKEDVKKSYKYNRE